MTHLEWLESLSFRKLRLHVDNNPEDQEAVELFREQSYGLDSNDLPDDTPTVANCDDWGTGEGRWHGRM